jgi:hypothetical protein
MLPDTLNQVTKILGNFIIKDPFNLFQLLDVSDDGFLSLMDDSGATRDDLKLPDGDIGAEIKAAISEGRDILVSLSPENWVVSLLKKVRLI